MNEQKNRYHKLKKKKSFMIFIDKKFKKNIT